MGNNQNNPTSPGQAKLTWLLLIVMVILFLVSIFSWGSAAKYAHQSQREAVVKAKDFYFTSDYLNPEGAEYMLNSDVTEITFELRNYDGLNVSEVDIDYQVDVDGEATVESPTGTIMTVDKRTIITLKNLKAGNTYKVTATGSNGYRKTLQATFKVSKDTTGVYKNTMVYDDYVLLTVWTINVAADNITISIPDGLIPDATDPALTKKGGGDKISLKLGANESRSYRFFIGSEYQNLSVPVSLNEADLGETKLDE